MSDTIYFLKGEPEALVKNQTKGSHIKLVEGATRVWVCYYLYGTPSSPAAAAFRSSSGSGNGATVTTTVFPTNSPSVSGTSVTLSVATGFVGNATYKIKVTATVNSQTEVHYFFVDVAKDEAMA